MGLGDALIEYSCLSDFEQHMFIIIMHEENKNNNDITPTEPEKYEDNEIQLVKKHKRGRPRKNKQ